MNKANNKTIGIVFGIAVLIMWLLSIDAHIAITNERLDAIEEQNKNSKVEVKEQIKSLEKTVEAKQEKINDKVDKVIIEGKK